MTRISLRAGSACALLAAAALLLAPAGAFAQTPPMSGAQPAGTVRALVVGIDNYKNSQTVPPLGGAIADAEDIRQALLRTRAGDITVLIDAEANRARLLAEFAALADRTKAGDVVIITFAGHGSQGKERIANSEPDHMDEFLLLWGFGNSGADTAERLLDDEMFHWLGKLSAAGARVVFLADVCHGGGLSKAPDALAGRSRMRYVRPAATAAEASRGAYFIADGADRLSVAADVKPDDFATSRYPSVTFIAGADDANPVVEVDIPGAPTPRGAASYAFARAIEGGADAGGNRDGATTRGEMMAFLNREIGKASRNRQAFVFEPRDAAAASGAMFANAGGSIIAPPASTAGGGGPSRAPGTPPSASAATGTLPALKYVYADMATGNVVSRRNGVMAHGLPPDELNLIAERFETEERFADLPRGQALALGIKPGTRSYVEGDRFAITAGGLHGRHLILMNLSGGGVLQYMFPRGEVSSLQTQDTADFTVEASPPFGRDAMIVIATQGRRGQLEAELQSLDGKAAPLRAWDAVMRHLGPSDRLGVISYRTRPRS